MIAFYTHCPFCGFPVVVRVVERMAPRHCRQCTASYVPDTPIPPEPLIDEPPPYMPPSRRASLRSRLRQRRRSIL